MSRDDGHRDDPDLYGETYQTVRSVGASVTPDVVSLTVLYHADPDRVGDRVRLTALAVGRQVTVSRLAPTFAPPDGGAGAPLADRFISRRPTTLAPAPGGGVALTPEAAGTPIAADGVPVVGTRVFDAAEVDRGVVLELGERVVLLLHRLAAVPGGGPKLGLIGESPALARVRASVLRVADLDVPVLLRGESGCGKELVARAIHAAGPRRERVYIPVNMGAIPASTAASELFGHRRGAFTGATRDHAGYFERADGGTLFLDEIADIPPEVQVMLLRVLETGEIQPVGHSAPRHVDVRVMAATDADLERAVAEGRFRSPLLHRLSGYEIAIPPLRQRRDDIGRLMIHFLAEELAAIGEQGRLRSGGQAPEPWLPAPLAARLARYAWPGNVRQLKNLVRQLVISNRGAATVTTDPTIERLLAEAPATTAAASSGDHPPAPVGDDESADRRPGELTDDDLLVALRDHDWKLVPTAAALGISRTSLYALIKKSDRVRTAREIPREEIIEVRDACDGSLARMSDRLMVSKRALQLRLKELGIES